MNNPAVFIKEPLIFKNKFKIYPPSVREVVSNPRYGQLLKVLTLTSEEIADELRGQLKEGQTPPSPFEFLLINCYNDEGFKSLTELAFFFFLHEPIEFLYEQKKIIIGDLKKLQDKKQTDTLAILTEEEYFDFQNAIREVCGNKPLKAPEAPDPNEDPRITAMKEKARKRDRIKSKQHSSNGISIQTCLVAICCMGIGITPLNIGEMSYAAIEPIMTMLQEKEKYDIDIRSLLAGADSKKVKPKYWIRNPDKD